MRSFEIRQISPGKIFIFKKIMDIYFFFFFSENFTFSGVQSNEDPGKKSSEYILIFKSNRFLSGRIWQNLKVLTEFFLCTAVYNFANVSMTFHFFQLASRASDSNKN